MDLYPSFSWQARFPQRAFSSGSLKPRLLRVSCREGIFICTVAIFHHFLMKGVMSPRKFSNFAERTRGAQTEYGYVGNVWRVLAAFLNSFVQTLGSAS